MTAQQEYRGIYRPQQVKLSLFFSDSHSIWIKLVSTDPTNVVISKIASAIGLPQHLIPYFGLFVLEITRQNESKSNGFNGNNSSSIKSKNGFAGTEDGGEEEVDTSALKESTASLITASPNQIKLLRKLQNFEAPFLTLETMESSLANVNYVNNSSDDGTPTKTYSKRLSLALRKCYWDCNLDCELFKDDACLNLLYHQTMSDLQQGWIPMTKEVKHQLNHFVKMQNKRDFLNLAKTLKYYSYIHFENSYSDYLGVICDVNSQGPALSNVQLFDPNVISDSNKSSPLDELTKSAGTKARDYERIPVIVSLGGKELLIRPVAATCNGSNNKSLNDFTGRFYRPSSGEVKNEASFKLTRIRCWRLTATEIQNATTVNSMCNLTNSSSNFQHSTHTLNARTFKFELSFEYLFNRNVIKSVTIESKEAVLMSMCLQEMVNESLSKRSTTSSTTNKHPFEHELYNLQCSMTASASTGTFIKMDGSKQLISSSIFTPSQANLIPASSSTASFSTTGSNASSSSSSSPSLNTESSNFEPNSCHPARQVTGCNSTHSGSKSNINVNSNSNNSSSIFNGGGGGSGNCPARTSKVLENEAFEGIKDEVV